MSATTGPQASDDDKNEPEPQDVEKSEAKEAVGAEIGIMPEGEGARSSLKRIRCSELRLTRPVDCDRRRHLTVGIPWDATSSYLLDQR